MKNRAVNTDSLAQNPATVQPDPTPRTAPDTAAAWEMVNALWANHVGGD